MNAVALALAINHDSTFFNYLDKEWKTRVDAWKKNWMLDFKEQPNHFNIIYMAKSYILSNLENNVRKEVLACSKILLLHVVSINELHDKPAMIQLFIKLSGYDDSIVKKSLKKALKLSNRQIMEASTNVKQFVKMLANRDD